MTEEKLNKFIYVALVLLAMGLIFIFFSHGLATSLADSMLAASDYAFIDYDTKLNAYINNFLVTGAILFGVGLSAVLLAYYKKLTIEE